MPLARLNMLSSLEGGRAKFDPLDEEESAPLKDSLIGAGLSGLGYVGSLFDKLGGRAIRGVLGGKPRELLSVLPFSDTLGITDPESQVSGGDLLRKMGFDPNSKFGGVNSFLLESALDPTTYLAPFGKTAKGLAAVKAGTAAKGLAAGLASGERSLLRASIPFTKIGADLGGSATKLVLPKVSFAKAGKIPRPTFGVTRMTGGQLASKIDNAVSSVAETAPVAYARGLFDFRVAGAKHPEVQKSAAEIFTPLRNKLLTEARGNEAELRQILEPVLTKGSDQVDTALKVRSRAERIPEAMNITGPIADVGDRLSSLFEDIKARDTEAGIDYKKLSGVHNEYATRQIAEAPPGDGGLTSRMLPTISSSQKKRKTPLIDVPGGTAMIEELVHDPQISGFNRPLDVKESRNKILDKLLLRESAKLNPERAGNIIAGVSRKTLGKLGGLLRPELSKKQLRDPELVRPILQGVSPEQLQQNPVVLKFARGADRARLLDEDTVAAKMAKAFAEKTAADEKLALMAGAKPDARTRARLGRQEKARVQEIANAMARKMQRFKERSVLSQLDIPTEIEAIAKANAAVPSSPITEAVEAAAQAAPQAAPQKLWQQLRANPELVSKIRAKALSAPTIESLSKGTPVNDLATALNKLPAKLRVTALKKDPVMAGVIRKSGQLARFLGDLNPKYAAEKFAFFQRDPITDYMTRARRAATSQAASAAVEDAILRNAQMVDKLKKGKESFVRLPKVLRQAALKGDEFTDRLFDRLGLQVPPDAANPKTARAQLLRNVALPKSLASDLTLFNQRHMIPHEVGPVLKMADAATQVFKRLAYTPFIGSHIRNLGTGIYNNIQAGALDPTRKGPMKVLGPLWEMAQVELGKGLKATDLPGITGATPIERAQSLRDRLYKMGVAYRPEMFNDVLAAGGPAKVGDRVFAFRPGVDAPLPSARKLSSWNPLSENFYPVALGQRFGGKIENALRGSMAIAGMRQGMKDNAIKALADMHHFDYGAITEFERNVMKRLVPFYTYSSRNLPLQLKMLANSPRSVTQPIRLVNNLRGQTFTPDYLGNGTVVPIGKPSDDGFQRYISSFGLPFEDAFERVKTANSKLPSIPLTMAAYAGMLNPYLKGPIEQAADYQFHTGRRLSDLKATKAGSLFGLLDDEGAQGLSQFLANTPITRFVSTLDKIADTRKGIIPKALNLGTGIKITDVDVAKAKAVEVRRALDKILTKNPAVSQFQEFYVKPENVEKLSPEQVRLMQLFNTLKIEAKEAAKLNRNKQQ